MKVGVKVMLKPEVLDPQGRAVQDVLERMKHPVKECRIGKYIELEVPASNFKEASILAKEMATQVLHNPLIERFEIEEL